MSSLLRAAVAAMALTIACVCMASASWTASLSGTVVDIKTLQPVADATIKVYENAGSQVMGKATSDAHGAFVISGLRGGHYRLQFEKPGYQRTIVAGVELGMRGKTHSAVMNHKGAQVAQGRNQLAATERETDRHQRIEVGEVFPRPQAKGRAPAFWSDHQEDCDCDGTNCRPKEVAFQALQGRLAPCQQRSNCREQ